jgi:multicomponent K+:H+ antiporter subunit E
MTPKLSKSDLAHGAANPQRQRSRFQRWLPHPLMSLFVAALWLTLNNSIAPGHVLLGLILGCLLPIYTANFWPDRPRLHSPLTLCVFLGVFVWDIVVANLQVAYLVLFFNPAKLKSQWICVPLDLRQPEAITVLAGTISLTPGTISSDLSADGRNLLVHCLHVDDPAAEVEKIKNRYERRLKAIFP